MTPKLPSFIISEQRFTTSNLGVSIISNKRVKIFPNGQMPNKYLHMFYLL